MLNCIFVGIGGFIGSVLRYLTGLIPIKSTGGFPIKTLAINVVGAFLIGIITALSTKNTNLSPQVVLLLKVGICGGFTTFSTFAYETNELFQKGSIYIALLYILTSVILSVLAVFSAQLLIK